MDAMVMPATATEQSATGLMREMAPGSVPRPRRRPLYTFLLWWVALLSCLLPVLYAGLVAGLAWLGYAYYAHWAPRGFSAVAMVAWTVPGFVLGVLILFLLKPFFAPRAKLAEPVALPESEAAFAEAVHALCRAVGVAPPRGSSSPMRSTPGCSSARDRPDWSAARAR